VLATPDRPLLWRSVPEGWAPNLYCGLATASHVEEFLMRKMIFLVAVMALGGFGVYMYLNKLAAANRDAVASETPSVPKQRLDRVRHVANGIEQDTQKRIDDLAKRSE
jgi:hypothetical protein